MKPAALDVPGALHLAAGLYGCLLGAAEDGGHALLRAIAGLARSARPIVIDGVDVGPRPPHRRGLAWLARHGAPPRARTARACLPAPAPRAAMLLDRMGIPPAADPATLDEAARLGLRLAAALARQPRLLLLDDVLAPLGDPLAALPMLRALTRHNEVTVLHATGRREDAFALADHLVLLDHGVVLQQGASAAMYDRPDSLRIACRLGPASILPATLLALDDDVATLRLGCGPVVQADAPAGLAPGAACAVLLRPERIVASPLPPAELGQGAIAAVLRGIAAMGDRLILDCALGADAGLLVQRPAALGTRGLVPGRTISVAWQARHALVFPAP